MNNELSCLILAGGESKRFGENKALYEFNGYTFLERAISVAMDLSCDIIISMRNKEQLEKYSKAADKIGKLKYGVDYGKNINIKFISDNESCGFVGPLRGIYSSISSLKGKYVLIMECDAPFFNSSAALELVEKAKKENVRAVVPMRYDSTVEPLLCCYETKYAMDILALLNDYALSLKKDFLFNDTVNILRSLPSVYYYSISEMVKNNPNLSPEMFLNINSKTDAELMKIADKKNSGLKMKHNKKSIIIIRKNKFFNIKHPDGAPHGTLARGLYFWWIYAVTKNFIYLKKSIDCFKLDSILYKKKGLMFMGDKLLKILPDINNTLNIGDDLR